MLTDAAAADVEVLHVGTEPAFAPFEYVDQKTKSLTGFDIDLIEAICADQKVKMELTCMSFDGLIPAILSGGLDVAIAGFTITEERAKKVGFSEPYYTSGLGIMINTAHQEQVKGVADLHDMTICAQIGTSGAMYATGLPRTKVKQFNTSTEAYLELKAGNCAVSINDKPVHEYYLATTHAENLTMLPEFITAENYGIVFNKKNRLIGQMMDQGLANIKANGVYARLYRKWFGNDPQ